MHKATCAECGKSCEVPFRPSGDKPVYCSNCFSKGGSSGSSKPDQSNRKHDEMNAKLDRILSLLQRMNPVTEAPSKRAEKKAAKKTKESLKIPVIFEKDIKKKSPAPVEKAVVEKTAPKVPKKKKAAKKKA